MVPNSTCNINKTIDDERNYRVSFDKIAATLGFKAEYNLETGIQEMIESISRSNELKSYKNSIYSNVEKLKEAFKKEKIS